MRRPKISVPSGESQAKTGQGRDTRYFMFTGGGTAGHVYPGMEVARSLAERGHRVAWIGSRSGIERQIVEKAGMRFFAIPAGKIRRYVSLRNFVDIFLIAAGIMASLRLLVAVRPRLLFAKGGYVSAPPVIAAYLLRIPIVIHESDITPGLATRITARCASHIFVAFEETAARFPRRSRVRQTGTPIRREFSQSSKQRGREILGCPSGRPVLLVLGGSRGSQTINDVVQGIIATLTRRWFVVHQTGSTSGVAAAMENYRAQPYIGAEFPEILAAADLVIGRAGATTLQELAATGTPSILVPLPVSVSRGDQVLNAAGFARAGAAVVLPQEQVTGSRLLELVSSMYHELESMGRKARTLADLDATDRVVDILMRNYGDRAKRRRPRLCFPP